MRKTPKSELAKAICKNVESSSNVTQPVINVTDGGYLLHVVHWTSDNSYAAIAQQYVTYIARHYGKSSVIVFDGYCNSPCMKDQEHQ